MKKIEKKISKLAKLWVKWNVHKITGDEFAYQFGKEFKKETQEEWQEYLRKK